MNRALLFVSAVALAASSFAATAVAQIGPGPGVSKETAVTGVVAYNFSPQAGSIGICAPPAYTLEGLEGVLYLSSATIDLEQYIGQNVKLHGKTNPECPILDVESVEVPPPASLTICGTAGFGCPMRLISGPGGLATHWIFVSASPTFLPLNPVKGSFLLGQPFVLVATLNSNSFSQGAVLDFNVPVAPALAGVPLYLQAARRAAALVPPGTQQPIQFGNIVTLQIVGFVLLCHDPNC